VVARRAGVDHCFLASVSGTTPPVPGGHLDNPNLGLVDVLQRWVENDEAPEHTLREALQLRDAKLPAGIDRKR
jgi:hypothetical protein